MLNLSVYWYTKLNTFANMQNFDVDAKPVGDAEHVDDAKLVHDAEPADDSKPVKTAPTCTAKPFYGFELVYKADGEDEIKANKNLRRDH